VKGVTRLHDVIYVLCESSSAVLRFNATTHVRLTDFTIQDLRVPWDIAACEVTNQLYVADWQRCVWRMSADGADTRRWLPKSPTPSETFKPWSLSVTSSHLLVTSNDSNQLIQFDAVGEELIRVDLPGDVKPQHAVMSPTGTFIVSHYNTQLEHYVSEVNAEGRVLRQFSGSRLLPLGWTPHVAVESHGNIFVAAYDNDRDSRSVLLLSPQLELRRVIIDEHQLNYKEPRRLCYTERSGQLLVGLYGGGGIAMFDLLCQ